MAQQEEEIEIGPIYDIKTLPPINKINCVQKGRKVYLDINGGPIYLHTPKMRVPFNLLDKKNRMTNMVFMKQISFSTELYENCDKNNAKHIKRFVQTLEKIDEHIFTVLAQYNSDRFIKYKSLYKKPDSDYAPTFSAGIKIDDALNIMVPVVAKVDGKDTQVCVTGGMFRNKIVKGIVKLENVWVSGNKVGISWSAVQLNLV